MKKWVFCAFKLFGLLQGLLQRWGQNININRSVTALVYMQPPPVFFFPFLNMHIWYDMISLLANTIQKHWFHNSCVLERYNQDTSSAYYFVHWSGLWQLMWVPEKCFVLIFTTSLVAKSSLWCVYEISARVSFGLISTGWIQNDRYKKYRVKLSVCIHVCAEWTFFPQWYVTPQYIDDFFFHFVSLALKRLTMWHSRECLNEAFWWQIKL